MSQAQHEHEVMAEQAIAFYAKVAKIQNELHAPKNQFNKFGNYSYRNCEDILEALKKVKGDLVVTVADDIVVAGDRFYIKATATITDGVNVLTNTAFAREALTKKGMDDSQITGAASSYARKYALNGLFCIDDNKDADSKSPEDNDTSQQLIDDINSLANFIGADLSKAVSYISGGSAKSLNQLNSQQLNQILNQLKKKQGEQNV